MILPELVAGMPKQQREIVSMREINFSDNFKDGDLAYSSNISARRFPYISTRNQRERHGEYDHATAITSWGDLVVVEGTTVYYDGTAVTGSVTEGPKQFAVVNTKLCIWPDKKYLDLLTHELKPLSASASGSGAVFAIDSGSMTMTVTWDVDFTTLFNVGDCVEIKGASISANNTFIVITNVATKVLTFATKDGMEAGSATGTIHIERNIPDLDYICESENRLWGVSNADRTIYASALGDPNNFYTFEGLSTDSYAVAVGSEGDFTGCCKLGSSVLFWKETVLHKILGSFPAEYIMYSYTMDGLRSGCSKSLQVINEVLYYMGLHGVYAYTGGTPSLISPNFGNKDFTEAVGGNDGDTYYLSVKDEDIYHLFAYETNYGLWVLEEDIQVEDFARIGKDLYMLMASGQVWIANSDQPIAGVDWMVQFKPFYETVMGRKIHSKLLIRTELPVGSVLNLFVRYDEGEWTKYAEIEGKTNDVTPIRIGLERADKFEIKIEGVGECAILNLYREYHIMTEA